MNGSRGTPATAAAIAALLALAAIAAVSARSAVHPATPSAATDSGIAARTFEVIAARPRGLVLDCNTQSGVGAGLREFRSRWNLVVGPLLFKGGAARPAFYAERRNKFPVFVKGGHRVKLELPVDVSPDVGLVYGQRPKRDGYRVITFVSCGRGELSQGSGSTAWPVSFWSGGVLARSPQCIPLRVWVDEERKPRRAVIYLGVRDCA